MSTGTISEYNKAVDKAIEKLKEMGFEYDPEPATRGHKNPNVFIRVFPKGHSLKISFVFRSTAMVLGLPYNPFYTIHAVEMLNDFRVLGKRTLKPRSIKGLEKAIRSLLEELPGWIQEIEKKSAAA